MTNATSSALPAGVSAPDFTLHTTPDQSVSLSDFRGQPVVLVFYPADFSPVCGDQLALYNQVLPTLRKYAHEVQLLGISVDGVWCHQAYAHDRKLKFPLLADSHPQGATAKAYGVFDETYGMSQRALFVIDQDGKITWSYVSPAGINPGADGILEALKALPKKG
ncbi:MAG: redoxin domain-containing protein [Armatimonadota bacterium]